MVNAGLVRVWAPHVGADDRPSGSAVPCTKNNTDGNHPVTLMWVDDSSDEGAWVADAWDESTVDPDMITYATADGYGDCWGDL